MEEKLRELLRKVPPGRVTTYKELSLALGMEKGWRAVAKLLSKNTRLVEIPCHRVVCSDGRIGGYRWGVRRKIALLEREGVRIEAGRVDLGKYFFSLRRTGRPP